MKDQPTINDWSAELAGERQTRVIEEGRFSFHLIAPASIGEIDAAVWTPGDLKAHAKKYQTEGMKIEPNHIQQARYIRLCAAEPKPTQDQLMRIAATNGPLFKKLSMAAMDLCGLLDWAQISETSQGNTPADEAP